MPLLNRARTFAPIPRLACDFAGYVRLDFEIGDVEQSRDGAAGRHVLAGLCHACNDDPVERGLDHGVLQFVCSPLEARLGRLHLGFRLCPLAARLNGLLLEIVVAAAGKCRGLSQSCLPLKCLLGELELCISNAEPGARDLDRGLGRAHFNRDPAVVQPDQLLAGCNAIANLELDTFDDTGDTRRQGRPPGRDELTDDRLRVADFAFVDLVHKHGCGTALRTGCHRKGQHQHNYEALDGKACHCIHSPI